MFLILNRWHFRSFSVQFYPFSVICCSYLRQFLFRSTDGATIRFDSISVLLSFLTVFIYVSSCCTPQMAPPFTFLYFYISFVHNRWHHCSVFLYFYPFSFADSLYLRQFLFRPTDGAVIRFDNISVLLSCLTFLIYVSSCCNSADSATIQFSVLLFLFH